MFIKKRTIVTWNHNNKKVVLNFSYIAYAVADPNSNNVAVVIMDKHLFPNNAFIYSPEGKILCSIESDEFMLFYSGIEDSEKELRLTCIKRKDKFIKSMNLLGSISYPATGGSYTNIISSDGKIISSFGTH